MNPNREELLFQLALTKLADERVAWLERECGEDKALCARVAALLAAHEQPNSALANEPDNARPTMKLAFPEEPADVHRWSRLPSGRPSGPSIQNWATMRRRSSITRAPSNSSASTSAKTTPTPCGHSTVWPWPAGGAASRPSERMGRILRRNSLVRSIQPKDRTRFVKINLFGLARQRIFTGD